MSAWLVIVTASTMTALPGDSETFVTHVLRGARFEGHSVPVAVLPELAAYRSLIIEIARALFFRDNPDRVRVPKGFEDGFDLVLRQLSDGSAVAPLERRRPAPIPPASKGQLSLDAPGLANAPPQTDCFERARDLCSQMLVSMRAGTSPPAAFPMEAARLFNTFGRSLRDDEAIEIRRPGESAGVVYDRKLRRKMVLLHEPTYEDQVEEISGPIVQFDLQKRTFGLVDDQRTIVGSLEGLSAEQLRIVRVAAVHTEALRVRVAGTGAFDSDDRLVRLVSITDITFAEDEALRSQLDVRTQLGAIADLGEGWLDGEGVAIDATALEWLAGVIGEAEREGLHRPYLYPTPDGAVQAEWSFPGAEVSALFDLAAKTASCVGVHPKSRGDRDEDIPLGTSVGISALVAFVMSFAP